MKKRKLIPILCGILCISVLTACNTSSKKETTKIKEETIESNLKLDKNKMKEKALSFGTAILEDRFEDAYTETGLEKGAFFSNTEWESYLRNTTYLKGLIDKSITIEELKNSLEKASFTPVNDKVMSCVIRGDIIFYFAEKNENIVIYCEDFSKSEFLIGIETGINASIDGINLEDYKATEEKQNLENITVYSLPNFSIGTEKTVILNETTEIKIPTISFNDETVVCLNKTGEVTYRNLMYPEQSIASKDMLAFLTIQNSSYDYKTEKSANVTKNEDGTISVKNDDGSIDKLDENGKFLSKIME